MSQVYTRHTYQMQHYLLPEGAPELTIEERLAIQNKITKALDDSFRDIIGGGDGKINRCSTTGTP